jgi:2-polyprenyl-6-methoxyphenol hydroxylase-like FAD-dependent oxidoreductase
MALHKAGIDPVIYEAHPSNAEGAGVFLTLGSNGIDALRTLGADKPALAAGFPVPGMVMRSGTGKRLGVVRTPALPDGTASHTLKRADLYRALLGEAVGRGIRVEHGKRLAGAETTSDGVRAVFADGTDANGDLLIGCDGIHSAVRKIIDPAAPAPAYAGLLNTGGYARGVRVDTEPGSYEMIFGSRAFFGYAVAPDREVWWFANVPRRDEPARGEVEAITGEEWRPRLIEMFADDAGPAVQLIEATPQILTTSPVHTYPHLPTWRSRDMIVIGDAAHAPSPSSGQGASLSIEDAVMLAKCLRDLPDAGEAFTRFEAQRRPRVERIIKAAARVNSSKAAGPVARVFRDAMLPLILKMTANSKQARFVYDYHIDWDSPMTAANP